MSKAELIDRLYDDWSKGNRYKDVKWLMGRVMLSTLIKVNSELLEVCTNDETKVDPILFFSSWLDNEINKLEAKE